MLPSKMLACFLGQVGMFIVRWSGNWFGVRVVWSLLIAVRPLSKSGLSALIEHAKMIADVYFIVNIIT